MENSEHSPARCPQFLYFDPLTGTVPTEHGPTFMGIADQARQILRRRTCEEICAAGSVIGRILNSREERRLNLTVDRIMRAKDQTMTAAKELRKRIGKKEIIDRPGFSKATRAEYFATLADFRCMTFGTPGRAGMCRLGRHSMRFRNSEAGSQPKWFADTPISGSPIF